MLRRLYSTLHLAGGKWNQISGYAEIQKIKEAIEQQETLVTRTRREVQEARLAYQVAIRQRSASQQEVNNLLQRKHAWSPEDLERFTMLYRNDHANHQQEEEASSSLGTAEARADEAQGELGRKLLARYHEEQVWSDKIRQASTYGTWALMGVNVVLFAVVQSVEPWKRRRLVHEFTSSLDVLEQTMRTLPAQRQQLDERLERMEKSLTSMQLALEHGHESGNTSRYDGPSRPRWKWHKPNVIHLFRGGRVNDREVYNV